MIENHLYSLVTVVKYKLLPCLLAIFLTGCDRTEVTLSFTPEMASFSNEFDFDPLRGPVKDFTQTLMDEQGEVTKRVSGTLSEEGCFDSLELLDLENNTVVALVLDANYYRDAETLEKRVRLQGKCQLAELPSAGVSWETDDNGFVIKASSKQMQMEYRYDDQVVGSARAVLSQSYLAEHAQKVQDVKELRAQTKEKSEDNEKNLWEKLVEKFGKKSLTEKIIILVASILLLVLIAVFLRTMIVRKRK